MGDAVGGEGDGSSLCESPELSGCGDDDEVSSSGNEEESESQVKLEHLDTAGDVCVPQSSSWQIKDALYFIGEQTVVKSFQNTLYLGGPYIIFPRSVCLG